MFILACVVGFMGPFGTYLQDDVIGRIGHWWMLFMGAYLLVRPAILLLRWLARSTELSAAAVVSWGVSLCSVPLAILWRNIGQEAFRELEGYAGLLPFSLLCALAVMFVAQWAESADLRLRRKRAGGAGASDQPSREDEDLPVPAGPAGETSPARSPTGPALASRLPPTFTGPILALQSEDHYVRVHGSKESELLLMRLRDAIAEMDGIPGEQVHRSWWVALGGITRLEPAGRTWTIHLANGETAPVARDSVSRLQRAGFLPDDPA